MYNPYSLLTPSILAAMLRQPMYFVRQHYPRGAGMGHEQRVPLLLTHYSCQPEDQERAERHMRLLLSDPFRFLYDSRHREHVEKLQIAAEQPAGFQMYINLLPKAWKPTDRLKDLVRDYVRAKLSWWDYTPSDKLKVTLKERYGHLFITLLWRGQQTEVLLEDIENFRVCATT